MAYEEILSINERKICDEKARKEISEHKTDSAAHVTEEEKNAWNNKSNFSGSYNDLSNKPSIPSKVSQLENDEKFLKAVPGEYITEAELDAKGYLTQHQDLSAYAKKTDIPSVPTKTSQLTNDSNFLTDVPSEYVTETELASKGYAKQTDVNTLSKEIADKVPKNQGVENVGKILAVGTDGNLVLVDMPEGGASGDVIGTFDEANNILLEGNIAIGTYTLSYVDEDGNLTGVGSLVVSEIAEPEPDEPTNFADPTSSDWRIGYRLTTDAFQYKAVTGSEVTNFVDVQNGDIVYVEGINFTDSNNRQTVSNGSTALGIGTVVQWAENTSSYYLYGETTYDSNSLQFKVNTLGQGTLQVRFSGLVTGTSNDVVINIKRNGVWL